MNTNTPVNTPANSVLGDLFAIDEDAGDTHSFALVSGNGNNDIDNNKFYLEGNQLKNNTPLIFLSESEYKIVVQATDAGGATIQVPLVISTQNQGNPPHNILLDNTMVVGLNSPPVFVGTLSASDVDQTENHVFSLPINTEFGPDNQYFSIVTNSLYLNSPLPVSEKGNYQILIAVTDSMGNQFTKPFQIIVKAELGAGDFFLNNSNLPENQPYNTIVGYFDSETYESSEYTFSLPLEVDLNTYCNHEFKLNGRTLITNEVFDFEKENTVLIQVNVTDGIKKITQDIPVNIIDANDPPTSISLSNQILSESAPINSVISTLSAEDQDFGDTHTFSLVVGNGINDEANGMFRINGNDLVLSAPLNYEQKSSHNILIRVTDAEGASFEQGLRLKVADANDAPEITSVPVNFTLQDQVYVYSIEVQDSEGDEVSLSFENLPAWLNFIPGSNLLSGVAGNEWVGVYQFNVVASDGKISNKQTVILTVINVNDPPEVNYFLNQQEFFSMRENLVQLPNDCLIDPDAGDVLTYKLSLENNSALPSWLHFNSEELSISGNPPHEAHGIWKLKLTATDKGNLKEWMVFDLNVAYPTAIGDLNVNNEFTLYPNPVKTNLFVQIPNSKHPAFIEIYNVSGQKLKSVQFPQGTQNKIGFEEFSPGVYIIEFTQGNERCQKKIVKH